MHTNYNTNIFLCSYGFGFAKKFQNFLFTYFCELRIFMKRARILQQQKIFFHFLCATPFINMFLWKNGWMNIDEIYNSSIIPRPSQNLSPVKNLKKYVFQLLRRYGSTVGNNSSYLSLREQNVDRIRL